MLSAANNTTTEHLELSDEAEGPFLIGTSLYAECQRKNKACGP